MFLFVCHRGWVMLTDLSSTAWRYRSDDVEKTPTTALVPQRSHLHGLHQSATPGWPARRRPLRPFDDYSTSVDSPSLSGQTASPPTRPYQRPYDETNSFQTAIQCSLSDYACSGYLNTETDNADWWINHELACRWSQCRDSGAARDNTCRTDINCTWSSQLSIHGGYCCCCCCCCACRYWLDGTDCNNDVSFSGTRGLVLQQCRRLINCKVVVSFVPRPLYMAISLSFSSAHRCGSNK